MNEQVEVNKVSPAGTHEVSPTTASSPIGSFKHPAQASASSQSQVSAYAFHQDFPAKIRSQFPIEISKFARRVPNRVTENISFKDKDKEGESSSSSRNFSQSQPVSKVCARFILDILFTNTKYGYFSLK